MNEEPRGFGLRCVQGLRFAAFMMQIMSSDVDNLLLILSSLSLYVNKVSRSSYIYDQVNQDPDPDWKPIILSLEIRSRETKIVFRFWLHFEVN